MEVGDHVWVWDGNNLGWLESGDIGDNSCFYTLGVIEGIGTPIPGRSDKYDVRASDGRLLRSDTYGVRHINDIMAQTTPLEAAIAYRPLAFQKWEQGRLSDDAWARLTQFIDARSR